ncbi:hypothetical protein ANN_09417 [Periplaneta americana]|uniref:Uncharacterized protein n=1 Tax=Periplaneta americana TaxID=6978 RepID=A0ABQ8TNT4_PERAM|nr:hypothetical protein ANN_09417 [Periplaneta americana]
MMDDIKITGSYTETERKAENRKDCRMVGLAVKDLPLGRTQYAIRKVQDNRVGFKLNGLHQLLAYADDENMLGENPQTIRKNTGILLEASKRDRNAYKVLVGRPEEKIPLGRPRRRWKDNIKMDLREVGYDNRDWINLAQDKDRWRAYVRATTNELDRRLRSREMWPTHIVQLSAMLQEEWRRIPVNILHKLVESMPDRVAVVIATRVGTTRF